MELIPSEKLKADLPTFFVEERIHWLDLSTSVIEIRPLKALWKESRENWKIGGMPGQYHVYKGRESLVGMQSQTWKMVSNLLECLDNPEDIVVTTFKVDSSPTPQLYVSLPYHGLSFFINRHGELESHDFKDMVCDENQSIGTLFSLINRLVLRAKGEVDLEGLVPRCVLVPLDPFETRVHSSHDRSPDPVTYHVYKMDPELGCLTGNSSLESKEFLAYLHAKTSIDWMPDPLTGKTGAHEALSILASTACQSLLGFLGTMYTHEDNISPWYPQIILSSSGPLPTIPSKERYLLQLIRGTGRAEYLFPQNIAIQTSGSLGCSNDMDMEHVPSLPDPQLEDTAYTAASVIYHWEPFDVSIYTKIVSSWTEIWNDAMSGDTTHSPSPYDGVLWSPDLPQVLLIKSHGILQEHHDGASEKLRLLFLVPILGYCSSHPQTAFLSMLLAFASMGSYRSVKYTDYRFLDGYYPTEKVLRYHVQACYSGQDRDKYPVQCSIDAAAKCLLEAWPSSTIPILPLDSDTWDIASLTPTMQALFSSCYRNFKLREDLAHTLRELQPASLTCSFPYPQRTLDQPSATHPSTGVHPKSSPPPYVSFPGSYARYVLSERSSWRITLNLLLSKRRAPVLPYLSKLPPYRNSYGERCSGSFSPLTPAFDRLFSSLRVAEGDPFQAQYIARLHVSAEHVREEYANTRGMMGRYPIKELRKHFIRCRREFKNALRTLKESLDSTADPLDQALAQCGQWPRITADSLLRCLASTSSIKLSESWKECLVSFALLLLESQRARRLLRSALEGLEEEFTKELGNEGCVGWDAKQYPDWLLIQVCFQSPRAHIYSSCSLHMLVARKLPHSSHAG